jgi:hypothetical protein
MFIGCGSGGSSSDTTTPNQNTTQTVTTVEEAKANAVAISKIGSISAMNFTRFQTIPSTTGQQKVYSNNCPNGGTLTYNVSEDVENFTVTYTQCKLDTETINGSLSMLFSNENSYELSFNNLTYNGTYGSGYYDHSMTYNYDTATNLYTIQHNGTMKQTENGEEEVMTTKNLIIQFKSNLSESWSKIDGGLDISSKCLNESYAFKTIEKLVEAKDKSDNLDSGIIEINGATFTFENPHVTIKTATEEKTILQSELEEENNSTSCKIE